MSALLVALLASALQVRVTPALAPCVGPALEAAARDAGTRVTVVAGVPDAAGDADLVVGEDSELTRLLEGGRAVLATAVDLGVAHAGIVATADGERRRRSMGPQMTSAAEIAGSRNALAARAFLAHLGTPAARARLTRCFAAATPAAPAAPAAMDAYGRAIVDWWIPQCSLERNGYNDPEEAVGPPDAVNLGGPDRYRGLVSLGQGGYVTVELGDAAIDRNGPDIRVFQTTTSEPVTLYASATAEGPFVLIGLRVPCGQRLQGVFSRYCDFDLREAGLGLARYVKIEDGEIYPCLEGGTLTEGADIDAVQTLNR